MSSMKLNRHLRLDWPPGWRRTPARKGAAFDLSYDRALEDLAAEIRMLGGRSAIVTHNPFRSGADPYDPGVSVWFDLEGARKVFACDRWHRVRDNVRAIALTINALRGIGRWGASDMLGRAFTGFDALPAPRSCWQILGVRETATADEIQAAWRDKLKAAHPDTGGSHAAMAEINAARDAALEAAGDAI